MYRKLLMFAITMCAIVTNAQIRNLSDLDNQQKLFIKHVNLITHTQNTWEVKSPQANILKFATTSGSEGAVTNAYSIGKHLKSLDLTEIIENNPVYPERTILFALHSLLSLINPSVLIDPKHVLIGGPLYYALADSPELLNFSSMDGYKILDDLGSANATDIYYFGTDANDFQNNMALATIDRPLGAIIGWMGYGYHTEDNYYRDNTFYVTTLETNENDKFTFHKHNAHPDMILDKGIYFTPQLDLVPGAPLYNANAATHGIISHWATVKVNGDTTIYDGATRITSTKYNAIASILAADRPDVPDIMPLHLSVEPGIINASDSFNEFIFFLHNYSEAAFSGEVGIDIYLSTDNIIDTSDIKLKSYNTGPVSMNSLFSAHYKPENKPTLPNDLSPGLYYLGAIINTPDANVENNTTPPSECAAVIVVNPNSSNYIAGEIIKSGESSGEGNCLLFNYCDNGVTGVADITTVESDLKFEFNNINNGKYIIAYVPTNSNNHRNIPTYYNNTAYWQDATILELNNLDSIKNLQLNRIELPLKTGTKSISGQLSKSEQKSGNTENNFFDDVTLLLKNGVDQSLYSSCCPDTEGNYIFENLVDGTYFLSIDKPGFIQTSNAEISLTTGIETVNNINFEFNSDSTIVSSSVTGMPLYLNSDISYSIFPNPVSEKLTIKIINDTEINKTLFIYNPQGKILKSVNINNTETNIDTRSIATGIYFLKIVDQNNSYTGVFIKK